MTVKIFFACALCILFSGCYKSDPIVLDNDDLVNAAPDIQWIAVDVSYVSFYDKPEFESRVLDHARKNDIFMVSGMHFVKIENSEEIAENYIELQEEEILRASRKNRSVKKDSKKSEMRNSSEYKVWYKTEKGWIDGSLVRFYDTKYKAMKSTSEKM